MIRLKIMVVWALIPSAAAGSFAFGAESYRDMAKRYRNAETPPFVLEQIRRNSGMSAAELPSAATPPEIEVYADSHRAAREFDEYALLEQLAPALLTGEAAAVRRRAASESIGFGPGWPLNRLLAAVYARNPGIQKAREARDAAVNRYPQAAFLEGILRQYNAFAQFQDRMLGGMGGPVIAAEFPYPGVTSLRGDLVQTEIQIAGAELSIGVRDALAGAKEAYHRFVHIHNAIGITEENRRILEQMLEVASRQFEAGRASYSDVVKARVALSELSNDLIDLDRERETLAARINTLMDRPPGDPLARPADADLPFEDFDLDRLYETARANRREIQIARLGIERMDLMIRMAEIMNRPEFTTGASYFRNQSALLPQTGGGETREEFFQPAPDVSLRPWFGNREAYIAEMRDRREAAREALERTVNEALLDIKTAHFSLDAAKRETQLYDTTLIPEARQSLEVAETDYVGARIGFIDYLDAERDWLEFNLARSRAMRDYGVHLAELERAAGAALGR